MLHGLSGWRGYWRRRMLKLVYFNLAMAFLMLMFGDFTSEKAFAIWGIMFMMTASIITIIGTKRHGS